MERSRRKGTETVLVEARAVFSSRYGYVPLWWRVWRMAFEKLRAYQAACELRAEVDKLREHLDARFEDLFRHVDEAVDSIKNNLTEGGESIYPGKQRLYYDHAGGSAREARSGLRSIDSRKGFHNASAFRAVGLTIVISKMVTGLIDKPSEKASGKGVSEKSV